jgi:hypothetical protein
MLTPSLATSRQLFLFPPPYWESSEKYYVVTSLRYRYKSAGSRIRIRNNELTQNLIIFNPKIVTYLALGNIIEDIFPGFRISDPGFSPITDAGPGAQKALEPGSQVRIRNILEFGF